MSTPCVLCHNQAPCVTIKRHSLCGLCAYFQWTVLNQRRGARRGEMNALAVTILLVAGAMAAEDHAGHAHGEGKEECSCAQHIYIDNRVIEFVKILVTPL